MHHPTDRIAHTTVFVTRVVEHWLEREIVQWVHPIKDRSDDPYDWNDAVANKLYSVKLVLEDWQSSYMRYMKDEQLVLCRTCIVYTYLFGR